MQAASNSQPTLQDLANNLQDLANKVGILTVKIEELAKEQSQSQKWQDRTWDVIKWVGGISAALAISAAIALVDIVLKSALVN